MKITLREGILVLSSILLSFAIQNIFFTERDTATASVSNDLSEVGKNYSFISPLLACGDYPLSGLTAKTSNEIESEVKEYLEGAKEDGDISNASVYFRGLNGGSWALINPDLQSITGSLLKVPLAISIYEKEQAEPGFLTTRVKIPLTIGDEVGQHYKPTMNLIPGNEYTVEELVEYLLKYSDNRAISVLTSLMSEKELANSFEKLGIQNPLGKGQGYTLPVRIYSSFFRVLYNSSYLSADNSEKILSILSESSFKDGLVSKLPKDLVVSHKFGERTSDGDKNQLHDCGIIYKKESPYILCVMTHGKDFDKLGNAISDISKIVYDILSKY